WRVACCHVGRLCDDRYASAGVVELPGEVYAGRRVVERAAVGDACRPRGVDCLTSYGRVPGQDDLALVLGLDQVVPVLWDVGDLRGVHLERQDAVVVAVPEAVRVLGGRRDRVPR